MNSTVLEAKGLGKRFEDGRWAVRGVDFAIRAGELVVLAGRNGAGKTVLAKMLAGLVEPTEGQVLYGGKRRSELEGHPASRVGYVFQDARLQLVGERVEDDVLFGPANLGMGGERARRCADLAIERCGLAERRSAFVHTLSGGELRRLALAGVIAMEPAAAILDEPFANLDREGVASVLGVVSTLASAGIGILVVTHELEKLLGMADRLDIMDGGRIVLSGEPSSTLVSGIEAFGLHDPLRPVASVKDLVWT